MERYLYQSLLKKDLELSHPFLCRYRPESLPALRDSIQKQGLLQPLIMVKRSAKYALLSGHLRLLAMERLGIETIPALVLQESLTEENLFLIALSLNHASAYSELDKAFVIRRALLDFKLPFEKVLEIVMPLLNLPPHRRLMEENLAAAGLDSALLDLMAEGKLPVRGSSGLARFKKLDQIFFAQVAKSSALTANQLQQMGEWLWDLHKKEGKSLEALFQMPDFSKILNSQADRRTRGEKIYHSIRSLRFPRQAEAEKKFCSETGNLRQGDRGIHLERVAAGEGEGFFIKARIKNAASLSALDKFLKENRKVLNSLLEIMYDT